MNWSDLGDRENENQVEEELERGDPLLLFAGCLGLGRRLLGHLFDGFGDEGHRQGRMTRPPVRG